MMKGKANLFKRLICVVFTLLMLASTVPVSAYAAALEEKDLYISEVEYYDENGARHTKFVDQDGNDVEEEEEVYLSTASVIESELPSKWDSRDKGWVTPVKNQSPYGTCWAFAFCAAAESSLIAQGYEAKDSIDLSEAHLVRFKDCYVQGSDVPVRQSRYVYEDYYDAWNAGGNDWTALATVVRGCGFTTEDKYPYSWDKSKMQFDDDDAFERDYDVDSAQFFSNPVTTSTDGAVSVNSNTMEQVKASISTYGAVATYYYNNYTLSWVNNDCYYYQNTTTGTNHEVAIIGWDDNVPASYFSNTPAGNGAWLVKNSWGSSWGNQGYFWLSYYDPSIYGFYEVVAVPKKNYDNCYQYDALEISSYGTTFDNTAYAGNVYTASGNETISGCGFQTGTFSNYKCKVSLYTNLSNTTRPNSGTLIESKTVYCGQRGFCSFEFDTEYKPQSGEIFSIWIEATRCDGGKANMPIEQGTTQLSKANKSVSSQGKSYIYKKMSTGKWKWVASANLPIKVYTKNTKNETEDPNNIFLSAASDYGTTIDYEANIIANILPGTKDLTACVTIKDGYQIEYDGVGTGKKVEVYDEETAETVETYTILIYGDINGDGWYDAQDAIFVSFIINGMLTEVALDKTQWMAADCNHDGQIDELDYALLNDAGILLEKVDQTASNLSTQSAYSTYTELIDQEIPAETDDNQPAEETENIYNGLLREFIVRIFKWLFGWLA